MVSMQLRDGLVPVLLAAGLAVLSPAPAHAQGMLDGLLNTMGLREDTKPDIDYRERAPLVVPPSMTLRPPQEATAKTTAAWPTDQETVKKRKEERERRIPRTEQYNYRMSGDKTTLSVDEMRAGRVAGAGIPTSPQSPFNDPQRAEQFDPKFKEQLFKGSKATAKTLVAGEEPQRGFLTDPPPGYRMPAAQGNMAIPGRPVEVKQSDNEEASPWQFWKRSSN